MGASGSIPVIPSGSYMIPGSENPETSSGPIYRSAAFKDELVDHFYDDARTLFECFERGVRISPDGPCMGWRRANADGTAGPFEWITYREAQEQRSQIGSGVNHLDLYPVNEDNLRPVGLYSKNRYEWVLVEQAMNAYRGVVVPLYDTLGPETVAYVVGHCGLSTVFCSRVETPKLLGVKNDVPDATATLVNVVQYESVTDEERARAAEVGITLRSLEDVMAAGRANPIAPTPPELDAIATFCYTSGTTGNPKGAMLSHRNIVADVSAAMLAGVRTFKEDVHLSYLPLAHMFERVVQVTLWMVGASVGFFQGDTLKLMEDIKELRPTIFPSVPRLWNRIYDKITQGVAAKGGIGAMLFNHGFESKRYWLQRNEISYPLYDGLVFSKVKGRVGLDRARLFITGSAPIAAHVMEFLRIVFSCPVVEGYGQTEGSAASSLTNIEDQASSGHVGIPLPCNEVKLVSVADMGYEWNDTFHGRKVAVDGTLETAGEPCLGRGEVCFRGHNIFHGYYHDPEKTAEAIDGQGWLHSGDIGLWTPQGHLRIVDRKKNIFKLSQGEYVAAEKIENVFAKSNFVAQVFVYGDSLQSCLVAIVVPDPDFLKSWAAGQGIAGGHTELCANEAVKRAITADMEKEGQAAKLSGFEFVKAIHVEPEMWTPEGGLLTPTFKLKRGPAKERYQAAIDAMYATGISVVAGKTGLRQG